MIISKPRRGVGKGKTSARTSESAPRMPPLKSPSRKLRGIGPGATYAATVFLASVLPGGVDSFACQEEMGSNRWGLQTFWCCWLAACAGWSAAHGQPPPAKQQRLPCICDQGSREESRAPGEQRIPDRTQVTRPLGTTGTTPSGRRSGRSPGLECMFHSPGSIHQTGDSVNC
jgi:hypothetical protein